jgi:hypothetical protein
VILILTFILSWPNAVQAQMVTSSFDTTIMGENPASAATRVFGIATPFISYTQLDQEIKDSSGSEPYTWERSLQIQRYEALYAGKKARFVPEIYVSQNFGNKVMKLSATNLDTENKVSMLNNHFNLGISYSDSIKIGIKFFQPTMAYKTDERYVLPDATVRTYESDFTYTEMGFGGGVTFLITKRFSIGGFYTNIAEKRKGNSRYQEGSNTPVLSSINSTSTIFQSGGGLAYQIGDSKSKGFRTELSYASMKFPYENSPKNNTLIRLTVEGSQFGYTGGVNVVQKEGNYIDYRYFIDSIMAEEGSSRPVLSYGGFLGFKAKGGTSFSGFASYSSGKGDISLFETEQPGKVTRLFVGFSYAYYF